MGLKAPGIVTFMLSVILTVVVLITRFFGAEIPMLTGNEFWVLLLAQVILVLGCIMRGL
jgi:heme/copper-type cytochrome/quinol oxidase subunit 4